MVNIPLNIAASLYDIPESALQPLRGGFSNHVYGFRRDDRNYVLRLMPPGNETDVWLQKSILAWMAHLAAHGASVPAPLPSQNGELMEVIPSPEGEWLAATYTQAEGILSEEIPFDQWDANQFQLLGKSIGRVHAIARGYVPQQGSRILDWEVGGNLFCNSIKHETWLKEKQSHVLEQIRALPRPADAYGLVHCDLHFANFFVDVPNQVVTLIDFDDCAYGWFAIDVAMALFDVLVLYNPTNEADKQRFALRFMSSYLSGYHLENDLPIFWQSQIPHFLKLKELCIYATLVGFPDIDQADTWGGRFMRGRSTRVANEVPYVDIDFSDL